MILHCPFVVLGAEIIHSNSSRNDHANKQFAWCYIIWTLQNSSSVEDSTLNLSLKALNEEMITIGVVSKQKNRKIWSSTWSRGVKDSSRQRPRPRPMSFCTISSGSGQQSNFKCYFKICRKSPFFSSLHCTLLNLDLRPAGFLNVIQGMHSCTLPIRWLSNWLKERIRFPLTTKEDTWLIRNISWSQK